MNASSSSSSSSHDAQTSRDDGEGNMKQQMLASMMFDTITDLDCLKSSVPGYHTTALPNRGTRTLTQQNLPSKTRITSGYSIGKGYSGLSRSKLFTKKKTSQVLVLTPDVIKLLRRVPTIHNDAFHVVSMLIFIAEGCQLPLCESTIDEVVQTVHEHMMTRTEMGSVAIVKQHQYVTENPEVYGDQPSPYTRATEASLRLTDGRENKKEEAKDVPVLASVSMMMEHGAGVNGVSTMLLGKEQLPMFLVDIVLPAIVKRHNAVHTTSSPTVTRSALNVLLVSMRFLVGVIFTSNNISTKDAVQACKSTIYNPTKRDRGLQEVTESLSEVVSGFATNLEYQLTKTSMESEKLLRAIQSNTIANAIESKKDIASAHTLALDNCRLQNKLDNITRDTALVNAEKTLQDYEKKQNDVVEKYESEISALKKENTLLKKHYQDYNRLIEHLKQMKQRKRQQQHHHHLCPPAFPPPPPPPQQAPIPRPIPRPFPPIPPVIPFSATIQPQTPSLRVHQKPFDMMGKSVKRRRRIVPS